jgi:hypothetical protein
VTKRVLYGFTAFVILCVVLWLWPIIRTIVPVLYRACRGDRSPHRQRAAWKSFFVPSDRITIFHGQPDPADATHFTIRCHDQRRADDDRRLLEERRFADAHAAHRQDRDVQLADARWSPTVAMLPEWLEQIATPTTQPAH